MTCRVDGFCDGRASGRCRQLPRVEVDHLTQQPHSWAIFATNGGTVDLSGFTSLNSSDAISIIDTGGSTLIDPNLTSLSADAGAFLGVTLDGTDLNVGNARPSLSGGVLNLTGGAYTLPSLTNFGSPQFAFSGGATLNLPVLTTGSLTLANDEPCIQGLVVCRRRRSDAIIGAANIVDDRANSGADEHNL